MSSPPLLMSTNDAISTSLTPPSTNVKKDYVRMRDHHLLPPRVGHNWGDQAFRRNQDKVQQLEGEWRGTRKYLTKGDYSHETPELGLVASQFLDALQRGRNRREREKADGSRFITLDDKVLRFYAFFRERAPEGGENDWWHRRVVICFYPEDESIMIEEPVVVNSGMDGGTFLKRQRVKTDPRQRELFPNDEYVSLNFFNVGQPVRINSYDYFLYDCDDFTRAFLGMLGVDVGAAMPAPADDFPSSYQDYQEKLASGAFGMTSQHYHGDVAQRAARFIRDSGKMLKFYALLDERGKVPGGILRKMELMVYVEDGTISITERQSTDERSPGLFLARSWLPKSGSISKINELTFAHRVNGQREPYMGPQDSYYRDKDLNVGMTVKVLGREVFLYDCDAFTRDFLKERYGIVVNPAIDVSEELASQLKPKQTRRVATEESAAAKKHSNPNGPTQTGKGKDLLRFVMRIADPKNRDDECRRFTLTWHPETDEGTVHETTVRNSGFLGGLFLSRTRFPKPPPPSYPRNAPERIALEGKPPSFYTLADVRVGEDILVSGLMMRITTLDLHTKAYLEGNTDHPLDEVQTRHLLSELLEYLGSRYGTAVKAFLAFDHDKDGLVSLSEFIRALEAFQITSDPVTARALFRCIAAVPDTGYLTTEDVMKWMGDEESKGLQRNGTSGAGEEEELREIRERAARRRALCHLKSRLEARCMDYHSMFRLASTMPRAYRGKCCGDILALTNPDRDAVITPVQLRRAMEEVLGGEPSEEEKEQLMAFFFPNLPKDQRFRLRDENTRDAVDLPTFHKLFYEMVELTMLHDRLPPMKGSVLTSGP